MIYTLFQLKVLFHFNITPPKLGMLKLFTVILFYYAVHMNLSGFITTVMHNLKKILVSSLPEQDFQSWCVVNLR